MNVKNGLDAVKKLGMKEKMVLLAAAGLFILLLILPDSSSKNTGVQEKEEVTEGMSDSSETSSYSGDETFLYLQEYTDYLENRLIAVLSDVDSVGEMEVMITLKASEEQIEEKDASTKTIMPEIEGVVISCTGGGSAVVVEEITEAVQALFSVESHKIKVLKKG